MYSDQANAFQLLIDFTPAAVAIFDRDMRYVAASRRYIADYRIADADLVGRLHYEVFPDVPEQWREIHRRCLQGAVAKSDEDPFPRADGTLDWVRWEIRPWYAASGEIGGIVLFSEVITERKQAQDALRLSEARHRQISSMISDFVYSVQYSLSGATHTEWISGAFERITGYTPEEVMASHDAFVTLLLPEDVDRLSHQYGTLPADGARTVEYRIRRKDGGIRWLRDYMRLTPDDAAPGVIHVAGAVQDITDQKRAEDALSARQRDLEALIDNTDGSIWAVDTGYRLIVGNARYHRDVSAVLGRCLEKGELVLLPAFPPEALAEWQGYYDRALRGEQFSVEVTARFSHPRRTVEYRVSPIQTEEGAITGVTVFGRDVSKQRYAENALRESEERFRSLFEFSNAIMLLIEPDSGAIVDANPAAAEFYGYSRAQLLAMKISQINQLPPDKTAAERQRAKHKEQNFFVFDHCLADGQIRTVEVRSAPIKLGAQTLLFSIIYDITERKRTEELIYAQRDLAYAISRGVTGEEAWRICLDVALRVSGMDCGGIQLFRADGRTLELVHAQGLGDAFVQSISRMDIDDPGAQLHLASVAQYYTADAIHQMPVAEREGLRCAALVPIRHQEQAIGSLNLASHALAEVPEHARRAIEVLAAEIGNFAAYIGAEAALRASEEKYRSLVEASDASIVMLDGDGRIHYANAQAADEAGRSILDLVGRTMHEMQPQAVADDSLARVRAVLASNQGAVYETARGAEWYRSSVQPVRDASGRTTMVLVSATEITELKRTQQELIEVNQTLEARIEERTAELGRAMRLKDEFLANMSHELRTPLNGILTLTEVLQEEVYGPLNQRQARSVQHIDASGRHLLALINDLLDLSKIEAGKLELEQEPVVIDEICQASLLFVKELAIRKDIKVSFQNDTLSPRMLADPRRLKQMLVNLLSNAVKFTPSGGKVHLSVRSVASSRNIEFAVQDTGPGIAPELQRALFQPFTQLDSALSRRFEGTGLGLALVKRLAEQHGGAVRVESAGIPGQGSCFTITLPEMPVATVLPSTAGERQAKAVGAPAAGSQILLVEDNEVSIDAISSYLAALNYRVSVARTGPEALAAVRSMLPDLILMDIQLPQIDGLEVTRRLRQDPRLAHTPIIAITALAMRGDRERCLAAGATEYMSKPLRIKELALLIERLLQA